MPDPRTTALARLPVCPTAADHGPMTLRPSAIQTPDERWCGTWYDCTGRRCWSSVLWPSPALTLFLASQRRRR